MRNGMAAVVSMLMAVAISGCSPRPPRQAATNTTGVSVEYLTAPSVSTALPFSAAVRVGDVIYVSGQIGNLPGDTSGVVPGGIEAETRQALDNLKGILAHNGSSMNLVVKCTVMLADMKEWPAMNAVYVTYFPARKPARSAFGATGLALGARVEIECWAVAGTNKGA